MDIEYQYMIPRALPKAKGYCWKNNKLRDENHKVRESKTKCK